MKVMIALPLRKRNERIINSINSLALDKSTSAPVDNFKNKLGSREKHSHSPQKSYVNFSPNGYAHHQHQNMNFGTYSPELPKCNSSLYPEEYYSHQGSQWQMHNPQAVNMNSKE